jgi:hypothetical protein
MQKQGKLSQKRTKTVIERPLKESDAICDALGKMATRLAKTISEDWIRQWLEDTSNYPVDAVLYALDSWGRNARKLPALADIIGILQSEMIPEHGTTRPAGCDSCNQGWIVVNPEAKPSDYKMKRCACLIDESLRCDKKSEMVSPQEMAELRARCDEAMGVAAKRFANGMPRYNRAATQARALLQVGR